MNSTGVLSGGADGNVRLWKIIKLNVITLEASMKEHRSTVNAISLLHDDTSAVTASDDGSCVVWDIERRTRRVSFLGSNYFKAIGIHPDEKQIITVGTDRKITWWDPSDASIIRVIDDPNDSELVALDISRPDAMALVVAGSDRLLRLFDYESGEYTHTSVAHASPITSIAFAPGARRIISASTDGAVFVWSNPACAFAAIERDKERHIQRVLTGELDDDDVPGENTAMRRDGL